MQYKREEAYTPDDNLSTSLRSVIVDPKKYNWDGDKPLKLPLKDTIIYEIHVGNFTSSPSSKCQHPGKFLGMTEKISYLKSLGITAVELMPVFDFKTGSEKNVWGYGSINFFTPDGTYCVTTDHSKNIDEFRDMVKKFHKAGIEVYLDVVFGYTNEVDGSGPTLCFKGFDNTIYYLLKNDDKSVYLDFSGCGNTLNCNHPVVSKFILDALEYWVSEMHVDGFRFDEASLLGRDENGNLTHYPHLLWNIDLSEKLADTKIFAEPWDAAGAYLVGKFPGYRYIEWNGRYRDDMRRFVRGDTGMAKTAAIRLAGSPDIYNSSDHCPLNSLNFVTAHDGFTLNDLVSYNQKHNEVNDENNTDGLDENYSWNCGVEGETSDRNIVRLRVKQIKNYIVLLMLSKGIPLITMGDEVARTQKGNNNAYCHNSELTWFDWNLVDKNLQVLEFMKSLIKFRKDNAELFNFDDFGLLDQSKNGLVFSNRMLDPKGLEDESNKCLSYTIKDKIHVMINVDNVGQVFNIPAIKNKKWYLTINTNQPGIASSTTSREKEVLDLENFYVENHSIVVLRSK